MYDISYCSSIVYVIRALHQIDFKYVRATPEPFSMSSSIIAHPVWLCMQDETDAVRQAAATSLGLFGAKAAVVLPQSLGGFLKHVAD